ncbi:hypothetical protein ACWGKQ_15910 [Streptomyces sp. NPDC054770]
MDQDGSTHPPEPADRPVIGTMHGPVISGSGRGELRRGQPCCGTVVTPIVVRRTQGVGTVIGMELPPDAVLVFDQDDDLIAFESFVHATNYLEAMDVSDGEYTATRRTVEYWH